MFLWTSALTQRLHTRWAGLRVFLHVQLTRQVGRHVDLGVEPLVGQQLRHAVQSLHSERVVGVWEKIDHRHRPLRQANLLRDEADARPAWLTLPCRTPLARHAVGQVGPATRVRRSIPLQDQCRLLQGADQVSGWRRGPFRDGRDIIFNRFCCYRLKHDQTTSIYLFCKQQEQILYFHRENTKLLPAGKSHATSLNKRLMLKKIKHLVFMCHLGKKMHQAGSSSHFSMQIFLVCNVAKQSPLAHFLLPSYGF